MNEITFQVEPCRETGGFVARWDAPGGGGITTQGDSLTELHAMISDAVGGNFHELLSRSTRQSNPARSRASLNKRD
jgi:predicted RNase H-like HicB family nuclease